MKLKLKIPRPGFININVTSFRHVIIIFSSIIALPEPAFGIE